MEGVAQLLGSAFVTVAVGLIGRAQRRRRTKGKARPEASQPSSETHIDRATGEACDACTEELLVGSGKGAEGFGLVEGSFGEGQWLEQKQKQPAWPAPQPSHTTLHQAPLHNLGAIMKPMRFADHLPNRCAYP